MDDFCVLFGQGEFKFWDFLQFSQNSFSGFIYFRPVTHFFNIITFHMFHTWSTGYHLFSLMLFWLGAVVLRRALSRIFSEGPWALLTAVFFCVHPINGILVNFKNATGFPFMILAMNLGLLFFLKGEEETRGQTKSFFTNGSLIASFIFFILALLCHEIVVVYPLYLFTLLYLIRGYLWRHALSRTAPFFVFVGLYTIFRSYYMSVPQTLAAALPHLKLTPLTYLASVAKLAVWYLQKMFTLQGIAFIWDTVVTAKNACLWACGLVAGIIAVALGISRGWVKQKEALMLSWAVIGFIPVGLACLTRSDFGIYIEPHWLPYTAIALVSLGASFLCYVKKFLTPRIWLAVVLLLVSINISSSFYYNYLWGNQKRYCLYWQAITPRNFWVNYWLGLTFLQEGNLPMAKVYYEKILNQGHMRWDLAGNMGIIEYKLGNFEASRRYFLKSQELLPNQPKTAEYLNKIRAATGH
jgi:hypothetical protein